MVSPHGSTGSTLISNGLLRPAALVGPLKLEDDLSGYRLCSPFEDASAESRFKTAIEGNLPAVVAGDSLPTALPIDVRVVLAVLLDLYCGRLFYGRSPW